MRNTLKSTRFAGRRKLMPFINRQNNEDLILALQTAGVSRGRNGFLKDKGGEKLAETEEDLLQHRTDGTDAFDTLYIVCAKFPQCSIFPYLHQRGTLKTHQVRFFVETDFSCPFLLLSLPTLSTTRQHLFTYKSLENYTFLPQNLVISAYMTIFAHSFYSYSFLNLQCVTTIST